MYTVYRKATIERQILNLWGVMTLDLLRGTVAASISNSAARMNNLDHTSTFTQRSTFSEDHWRHLPARGLPSARPRSGVARPRQH
jgi:hypothetical protein